MTAAEPWLPLTALLDGALLASVEKAVESWRSRWINSPKRCAVRTESIGAADSLPTRGWGTRCNALRFRFDAKGQERLLALVLQSRRAAQPSTRADKALLDGLCARISSDLLDHTAGLFGAETGRYLAAPESTADGIDTAAVRFIISGSTGTLGLLVASAGAAARARKSLVKPNDSRTPLEARSRVTANQHLKIGAFVGAGEVSLSDLGSLAVGDVLVLDRPLTSPLDITINKRVPKERRLEVRRDGTGLVIRPASNQADGFA